MGVVATERKSNLILTGSIIAVLVLLGFLGSMGYFRLADWLNRVETPPRVMLSVPANCDLSREVCTVQSEGLSVSVYPSHHAQALKPFPFQVHLDGPLADTVRDVTVHFAMIGMDMGVNRFQLQRKVDQRWQGKVILPLCTTGRSDWIATVEIKTERLYGARFSLTVSERVY